MRALLEAFGFRLTRVEGSHHIFVHDLIAEQLNLQSAGGDAKPYQIRQFLRLAERYALRMGEPEMTDYHINIFYSDEDGGYIADIPDLESCSAFGNSPEEALAEVEIAKAAWIEAARAEGKSIPAPRYRPVINQAR